MDSHICCIFNYGPHYRWPIYNLMSKNFKIDFCLGDKLINTSNIKKFNYNDLEGFTTLLKNVKIFGPLYWQVGAIKQLFNKKYSKYLILGEPFCLSSWIILFLAKILSKEVICWTHGYLNKSNAKRRKITRFYFSLFDKIMTYNERSKQIMIEEGIDKSKFYVIANSLDTDSHLQIRTKLEKNDIFVKHFGNNFPTVIYCGRIQKIKRLDLLFEALVILKNRDILCNLLLVGKEDENVNINKMIDEYNLKDNVWCYGACYDEELLASFFYNSAVCVSPGNVGLTAIHSLSFGCPVITNDNLNRQMPEFESIKPSITGDFFKENDVEDLASIIYKWINKNNQELDLIHKAAFAEIDRKWNIYNQLNILKDVFS